MNILEKLSRTTDQIIGEKELIARLSQNKPLRIKYGVDVTAPFLHIGHAVNLWMMRQLQEAGHRVIFLIGDFTTRIGDPTGKSKTRSIIDPATIEKNAQEFLNQVEKVLLTSPEVLKFGEILSGIIVFLWNNFLDCWEKLLMPNFCKEICSKKE